MFRNLVNLYSTTIKDAFGHVRGNIGELPNQIRETVARQIINFLLKNLSRYHHHHHVTPLLCRHATHILPMDHYLYHVTYHPSPLHGSTP